jgi:hypothetical protein
VLDEADVSDATNVVVSVCAVIFSGWKMTSRAARCRRHVRVEERGGNLTFWNFQLWNLARSARALDEDVSVSLSVRV